MKLISVVAISALLPALAAANYVDVAEFTGPSKSLSNAFQIESDAPVICRLGSQVGAGRTTAGKGKGGRYSAPGLSGDLVARLGTQVGADRTKAGKGKK